MTASVSRRPPAPTCEDWDDDVHGFHPDNRSTADADLNWPPSADFEHKTAAEKKNHDGSDSGYSSKAGTSETMSTTSLKKGGDLKIDTNERQRNPYSYVPPPTEEPRMSPAKGKPAKVEKAPKSQPAQRFQHPHGLCWTCDQYGYHFDIEKDIQRPATTAPSQTQKVPRSPAPKARSKDESESRPSNLRRSSSNKRDSRPLSVYAGPSPFAYPPHPVDYSHPMLAANGWQTPPQYVSPYQQYQYHQAPPTPMSATFSQAPGFFDMSPMGFHHPEPVYGEPVFNPYEERPDRYAVAGNDKDSQRTTSREPRPRSGTQKSKKSVEAENQARILMPPPQRTEKLRPIIKKSPTEYATTASRRKSFYDDEEDDQQEYTTLTSGSRNTSQSRPPSSYKPVANGEMASRPRAPRKSLSYSTSSGVAQVASSTHREMPRRRTDPLEQRVADAENYVAKTNRYSQAEMEAYLSKTKQRRESDAEESIPQPSKPVMKPLLTTEALKKFEQKDSTGMSETASVRSKQSSSRDSITGRVRAGTALTSDPRSNVTNIVMNNGISLSIPADCVDYPLDIMLGNMRLSMNPVRDDDRQREMKRIEKAPSEISHSSRRSLTSGSAISVPREKDIPQNTARSKPSANSSKRQSRAPSTNRVDRDRGSIDYSLLDESYYLEY